MQTTSRANIIYVHNLEVDQNLHGNATNNEKFSALTFLSKYRFTVAKHGLPASWEYEKLKFKITLLLELLIFAKVFMLMF